jgi:3'(2'), 5'-bisphosphate nucleotidase
MNLNELIAGAVAASVEAGNAILEVYDTDFSVEEKEDSSPLTLADKRSNDVITDHLAKWDIPILSEEGGQIPFEERSKWSRFWLVDPLDGTKEFVKRNGEFTVNIALVESDTPIAGVIYVPVLDTLYFGIVGDGAYRIEGFRTQAISTLSYDELKSIGEAMPESDDSRAFTVVASRSHMSEETAERIETLRAEHGDVEILSKGSSLKICMVAEGRADEYPRFGPTMEWDTGAGHAIVLAAGKQLLRHDTAKPLTYNKEDLLNPWFIVN